jgi:hypothetical protein
MDDEVFDTAYLEDATDDEPDPDILYSIPCR